MKLTVATNEVLLSNVGTTGEFKIRNSAKAFKILSDGLYSNKIRAIIRELSCNAVDSHVSAGKASEPFEVHLPGVYEPWFAVRDFGTGLDGNQVTNIYTTYFESTKTNSNDFIGALGLGSKSPFSYTDNFTVTAIKDGVKRIYSAFINDEGVPSIAEMAEELTDEINGVEVKFSVNNRYDYDSFSNEARQVLTWFQVKPNITGVDNFKFKDIDYKEKNIIQGVHETDELYFKSIALMGNIPYPIHDIPDAKKHFGDLASLLGCNLVIEFDIGELDFAASREQLSYIPLTINSIRKKLEKLNDALAVNISNKADAIENEWHRAAFLSKKYNSSLFNAAVIKYVLDTKFPLIDTTRHYYTTTFTYNIQDLTARGLNITGFKPTYKGVKQVGNNSEYVNGQFVKTMNIPVEEDTIIVLDDLKTGCISRAKYQYGVSGKNGNVFCISHLDPDMAVRQLEYDKILTELHNPPTVVMASDLDKPVRKTAAISTRGIMVFTAIEKSIFGYHKTYKWEPFNETIDNNVTYYYVALNNRSAVNSDGVEIPISKIKELMDRCGINDISKIKLFGVRKSRINEIEKLSNWIWFEDVLREKISNLPDAYVTSLVATEIVDTYYNKAYTNREVAALVDSNSDYAKYVNQYNFNRVEIGFRELIQLCTNYGKLNLPAVTSKIEAAQVAIYKKYPMLKHVRESTPVNEIVNYVNLMDKN